MASKEQQKPPEPPEIRRKFQPPAYQAIGVCLLVVFVLLGAFRVFGPTVGQVRSEVAPLRLEVTHPERTRLGEAGIIDVRVTNTGTGNLETVTIRFNRDYIDAFSTLAFTPGVDRISAGAYEVELSDVRAGETRAVSVDVVAGAYWRHQGFIEAATSGSSVRVQVTSLVFP
jgi:hypothetical protein